MLVLIAIILSFFNYFVEAKSSGFTVDIIHRDSPESPFYNASLTHYERVENSFHRSSRRINSTTGLFPSGGEYLIEISYGTPPFKTFAMVDTGSDFSWTQCVPCVECHKDKYPPFDPSKSSTYTLIPCTSYFCKMAPTYCDKTTCLYNHSYGDAYHSEGTVGYDAITFNSGGEGFSFKAFLFGCGHVNTGEFPDKRISGVLGLGSHSFSLIAQLDIWIQGVFSYCLAPSQLMKPGKIRFGDASFGDGVVRTRLAWDKQYYLILEGISVESTRINFTQFSSNQSYGRKIVIDSGTAPTFLPSNLYEKFESTMKFKVNSTKTVSDPTKTFGLCYSSLQDDEIPQVTMHFLGVDLSLKPLNLFVGTSNASVCLAFIPTDWFPIYGNIAQTNFWVGYDLVLKRLSFKPTDCAAGM